MRHGASRRFRQLASILALIVAVVATAATSAPYKQIEFSSGSSTVMLDREHPAAIQRFVVHLGAEATVGRPRIAATLAVDGINRPREGTPSPWPTKAPRAEPPVARSQTPASQTPAAQTPAAQTPAAQTPPPTSPPIPTPRPPEGISTSPVRLLVTAISPTSTAVAPSATSGARATPAASPWESVIENGGGDLPIDCGRAGPCERGFWLIAELADPSGGPIDVRWHVTVTLEYGGLTWPADAKATVAIDEASEIGGPIPQLVASTPVERVELGPDRPAAARLVEVTIGGAAIGSGSASIASMAVDVSPAMWPPPLVRVFAVGPQASRAPGSVAPPTPPGSPFAGGESATSAVPAGADPFEGCASGRDCTRTFLVAMSWDQGQAIAIDWQLVVRRVDPARAWSTPAPIEARIVRRFDVSTSTPPATLHFEGDTTAPATGGQPVAFSLRTSLRAGAADPAVALLPVPGVLRYHADVAGAGPGPGSGGTNAGSPSSSPLWLESRINVAGSDPSSRGTVLSANLLNGPLEIAGNPFLGCRLGTSCPQLSVEASTSLATPPPSAPVPLRWTLDVSVYSYEDVAIDVEGTRLP